MYICIGSSLTVLLIDFFFGDFYIFSFCQDGRVIHKCYRWFVGVSGGKKTETMVGFGILWSFRFGCHGLDGGDGILLMSCLWVRDSKVKVWKNVENHGNDQGFIAGHGYILP